MAKNNERKKIKQTNNNKNAQKHNPMEKKVTNYGFQNFLGKKKQTIYRYILRLMNFTN